MRSYPLHELAAALGGTFIHPSDGTALSAAELERMVRRVWTDTRSLEPGDLFVPLSGERFDGHDYLMTAAERGAVAVLVSKPEKIPAEDFDLPVLVVHDCLDGYAALAAMYRAQLPGQVIAVTGSVGKTSTRGMIAAALGGGDSHSVHSTKANLNNRIGLSATVLDAPFEVDFLVTECGVDGPGQMDELTDIVRPDIAVVTSIGHSHIENYGSVAAICQEKLRLGAQLGPQDWLVLNGDDPLLRRAAVDTWNRGRCRVGCYVTDPSSLRDLPADLPVLVATDWVNEPQGARFTAHWGKAGAPDPASADAQTNESAAAGSEASADAQIEAWIPVSGRHQVLNALAGLFCAHVCGLPAAAAVKGLARYQTTGDRQRVYTVGGLTVINDTYNASEESMKAGFELLASLAGEDRRPVVALGSVSELGDFAPAIHQEIGRALAGIHPAMAFLTGVGAADMEKGYHQAMEEERTRAADTNASSTSSQPPRLYPDRDALTADLLQALAPGDILFVKGSRSYRMEEVCKAVEAAFAPSGDTDTKDQENAPA